MCHRRMNTYQYHSPIFPTESQYQMSNPIVSPSLCIDQLEYYYKVQRSVCGSRLLLPRRGVLAESWGSSAPVPTPGHSGSLFGRISYLSKAVSLWFRASSLPAAFLWGASRHRLRPDALSFHSALTAAATAGAWAAALRLLEAGKLTFFCSVYVLFIWPLYNIFDRAVVRELTANAEQESAAREHPHSSVLLFESNLHEAIHRIITRCKHPGGHVPEAEDSTLTRLNARRAQLSLSNNPYLPQIHPSMHMLASQAHTTPVLNLELRLKPPTLNHAAPGQ